MKVMRQDELPFSRISREFVGADHGDVGVCLILVDAPPGRGPGLHRHPHAELFLVQEGAATFTADGAERAVGPGDLVVVPAGTPHKFLATGESNLRMTSVQPSSSFSTEWLDDDG
jgi:quercetin dioxygenase-like cupin family protein